MSGTLTRVKGFFKPRKSAENTSEAPMNIGDPTDFQNQMSIQIQDGVLKAHNLPPEIADKLPKEFRVMMTAEEAKTEGNNQLALNALQWGKNEEKKQFDYIRGDFLTPGSSGGSGNYRDISSGESLDETSSKFYVPTPAPRNIDHVNQNVEQEGTTLRRKNTKKGPKLDKNMSETEVYSQLRDLCSFGHPQDKYKFSIELGAGAGGTVNLATDKRTGQMVAIKKIEMAKQPKKEMILMEIRVMKELNHKNLVNFVDAFFRDTTLWVVMEYLAGKLF